jgi:hypothetical protein
VATAVDAVLGSVVSGANHLPRVPGLTGTVALVVTGGSDGDVKVSARIVDGRPVAATAEAGPEPDLTLTLPVAELAAVAAGTLDPSVAFMRGRLKTSGDHGILLGVLASTADSGYASWLAGMTVAG